MVQTEEEWHEAAKNVNLEQRDIPKYEPPENKDYVPTTPLSKRFIKYNLLPGDKELNLSTIKHKKDMISQGVIDPNFRYMAYSQHYYTPFNDQISGDIYVQHIKDGATRMQKALNTSPTNAHRRPAIEVGTKEFRDNMFTTLTIVDFSNDSKKLVVKEKIGSTINGIYRSYIWVYFFKETETDGFAIRFSNLNEAIEKHFLEKDFVILDKYMWDIKPLGFSKENPNLVIVESFVYDLNKKPIFLGVWAIDTEDGSVKLISETLKAMEITVNGLVVEEYYPNVGPKVKEKKIKYKNSEIEI